MCVQIYLLGILIYAKPFLLMHLKLLKTSEDDSWSPNLALKTHKIAANFCLSKPVLTIRNGSKTTPCFVMRRADGSFHLWW